MPRYIDADALLSDIERTIEESGCVNHEGEIMDCIRYASEVDAAPVVRGEWQPIEEIFKYSKQWRCSICKMPYLTDRHNYCPNCGADNRRSEDA